MRDNAKRYWREVRGDGVWWACLAGVLLSLWLLVSSVVMLRIWFNSDYAEGYAYCLPSKLYGWICAGDKR